MGYIKAEEILPEELIGQIQQYVDGKNIYIPRKTENKKYWGQETETRKDILARNQGIYREYCDGVTAATLADKYYLSKKSIQRIVRMMKEIEEKEKTAGNG